MIVGIRPPVLSASSTRSKASAEIRTPAPNAITAATTCCGTRTNQATSAPTTSAPPAINPQAPACNQIGTVAPSCSLLRSPSWPLLEGHRRQASGRRAGCLRRVAVTRRIPVRACGDSVGMEERTDASAGPAHPVNPGQPVNPAQPVNPEAVQHARSRVPPAEDCDRLGGAVLSLIAGPTRIRLLYALDVAEELCVGDLALALGASEDSVGYGLRMLRTAGLVTQRKQGRVVFYRLADGFPEPLRRDYLHQLIELTRTAADLRDLS